MECSAEHTNDIFYDPLIPYYNRPPNNGCQYNSEFRSLREMKLVTMSQRNGNLRLNLSTSASLAFLSARNVRYCEYGTGNIAKPGTKRMNF